MKKHYSILFTKTVACALFISVALLNIQAGCNKAVPAAPPPPTIAALINTGTNFTVLKAAMVKAGLETTLNGSGTFTVFAPTNNAFATMGITVASINTLSVAAVTEIFKYHIINTFAYTLANFTTTATAVNSMALVNNALYLKLNNGAGIVNGKPLAQANILASNGVLHVLDEPLGSPTANVGGPTQNIFNLATADTALKLFVQAVNKTMGSPNDIKALLTGTTAYTIFAPTNTAFIANGMDSTAIANALPATLVSVLQYHTLAGRMFSTYFNNLELLATLNTMPPQPRVFKTTDIAIRGAANTSITQAKVEKSNFLATNGVLHVIDKVVKF